MIVKTHTLWASKIPCILLYPQSGLHLTSESGHFIHLTYLNIFLKIVLSSTSCWRRDRLPTPVFLGFLRGSAGKESACNAGDLGLIPGLGRSPGEGNGYPLQYSGLKKSMDCIVHGVTKSRTRLSNFHFHEWLVLEPECLCSSKIYVSKLDPQGDVLGGEALAMWETKVRFNSWISKISWRRAQQPTPLF